MLQESLYLLLLYKVFYYTSALFTLYQRYYNCLYIIFTVILLNHTQFFLLCVMSILLTNVM